MSKISIIIPTYNRAQFVAKAIASILRQNFTDREIIVVDDGSTDNTSTILAPFEKEIKYIFQQNAGVSAARNTGISAANGMWIAFLDSDDEWKPGYLEWQMKRAEQYPKIVTHITNALTIKPNQAEEDHFQGTRLSNTFNDGNCLILERPLSTVIKHRPWFLQAAIMRRDVLFSTGLFDTSLRIGEDLDVIARMALKGPFSICNKQLVCIYRREEELEHLSGMASSDGLNSYESWSYVFTKLRKDESLVHREKKVLDAALSENKRALANLLLRNGRTETARAYYRDALYINPTMKSLTKYLISFLPAAIAIKSIKKGKDVQLGSGEY